LSPDRKKKTTYLALNAFFEQEKELIARNLEGLRDLLKKNHALLSGHELRAEALYIHDFYNSAENIFKTIAEETGGGIPRGDAWHKNLLLEMHSAVSGERKKILSDETFLALDEILRFRHLVRNSYGIFLDKRKTRAVSRMVLRTVKPFLSEIKNYILIFAATGK